MLRYLFTTSSGLVLLAWLITIQISVFTLGAFAVTQQPIWAMIGVPALALFLLGWIAAMVRDTIQAERGTQAPWVW